MMSSEHKKRLFVMAKNAATICLVVSVLTAGCASMSSANKERGMNRLVIHTDKGKDTINKNIYGHFSEHLGRCIYDGIWVGED